MGFHIGDNGTFSSEEAKIAQKKLIDVGNHDNKRDTGYNPLINTLRGGAPTMNIEYYIINGRGDDGLKFQLAKLKDEAGNTYKGQYDMSRHFSSVDEMKDHIANDVVKKPLSDLSIEPMNI